MQLKSFNRTFTFHFFHYALKWNCSDTGIYPYNMEEFMNQKGFNSILEMKGRLNYSNIQHLNDAAKYERFQFVKTFGKM